MGLQGNFTDSTTNMAVSDAYFRVGSLNGGKEGFQINVETWYDQATRAFFNDIDPEVARFPVCIVSYNFVPNLADSDNFITQAYDYLKTLPEFSGVTDV